MHAESAPLPGEDRLFALLAKLTAEVTKRGQTSMTPAPLRNDALAAQLRLAEGPPGACPALHAERASTANLSSQHARLVPPFDSDLPPLLPGLPNTPIERCQALIAAVIWGAICDGDAHWVASYRFTMYCTLLGMDRDTAHRARRRILSGAIASPRQCRQTSWLGEDEAE